MSIKLRNIFILLTAASLTALAVCALATGAGRTSRLLLIAPKTESPVNTEDIDELSEKFLLAYVSGRSANARALNSSVAATVRYTNYTYPFVLNYVMKSGSFFSLQNQEQQQKIAVLNEQAAFDLFGSVDIVGSELILGGDKYKIAGVMDDGDEVCNIFLPTSLTNQQPSAFLAALDESKGITQEFVKNEFSQTGVSETVFDFYNLGMASERIRAKSIFAAGCLVLALAVYLLRECVKNCIRRLSELKAAMSRHYLTELLTSNFKRVLALVASLLTTGLLASFVVWLMITAVDSSLQLQVLDMYFELYHIKNIGSAANLQYLQQLNMYTDFCLIAFLFSMLGAWRLKEDC